MLTRANPQEPWYNWIMEDMMNKRIAPGDYVTLGPENGLGTGAFLVLEVHPRPIHGLYVRGSNGNTWWARMDGARVVR